MPVVLPSQRPLGVDESLYSSTSDASLLSLLQDCRNPELNSISSLTLSNLLTSKEQPYLIIDCRFEYEYLGGHIQRAININTTE